MKIILHGISKNDGLSILALRAGHKYLKAKPGETRIVEYENGERYEVRRNQMSVAVWPLGNALTAETG